MSSTTDFIQKLASCEIEVDDLGIREEFAGVLKGVLFAIAISAIDRSVEKRVARKAQVSTGNLGQRWLAGIGGIPVQHRRVLLEVAESCEIMSYCIGAIAVARVRWAAERLGYRFKTASVHEAQNYGIEAWIESGRWPMPIQVRASRGTHASACEIIRPESDSATGNRIAFAWEYLRLGNLPEKVLLVSVDAYEGVRRNGSASADIEEAHGLMRALSMGIRLMES